MTVNHENQFTEYLSNEKHIALMMRMRVKKYGSKTALKDKPYDSWHSISWESFGNQVDMITKALPEVDITVIESMYK